MTDFTEKFKTYSNSDLLKIIENPGSYQPLAVETAEKIFASRQLSDHEIEIIKVELASLEQEKIVQDQKKKDLENRIKDIGTSFLSSFNPIQSETPNSEKIIKTVSIVFGGFSLFQLYKDLGMLRFMFIYPDAKWDFSMVLYFLPLILILTATILFFKRKKLGWTLLAIFLSFSAVNSVILFIQTLNRQPSGISAIDNLFPQTSPAMHVLAFLFFTGTLWAICKEEIRDVYNIDKKHIFKTIGITAMLTILMIYSVFM